MTMGVGDDDFEIKFWNYWQISVETSHCGVSFSKMIFRHGIC